MLKKLTLLSTALLFCASLQAAQMYRWIDDLGVTQFGQNPPTDRPYEAVGIRSAPPPGGFVRAPAPDIDAAPQDQGSAEERAARVAREKRLAEECGKLRENLQLLLDNPRLRRTTESGEVVRIDEEERQQLISETREQIQEFCNN